MFKQNSGRRGQAFGFTRLLAGLACLLAFTTSVGNGTASAAKILFIGETPELAMGDPFVLEHLEGLGHEVTYEVGIDTSGDDVVGFDLLVMSSTNLTSNIRENGFDLIPEPILTWESSMVRIVPGEFFMTEDQMSGDMGSVINVVDASHPIMAGLDVSDGTELEIFDGDQNLFGLTGEVAPGAELVAVGAEPCCDEDRTMIVVLPAGAQALPGSDFPDDASPGTRVFLPISDTSFEFLNDAGIQIFDNAVDYALGGSATLGDFNGDGLLDALDIDLLTGEVRAGNNSAAFDVTGDALVDQADRLSWIADLKKTWVGDVNLDGEFNTGDFVAAFTVGEYEDGTIGNSTWSEGDWDGNGDFDSGDFVAAFTDGGFEQGVRAATSAVPEPGTALLLVMGLAFGLRRK